MTVELLSNSVTEPAETSLRKEHVAARPLPGQSPATESTPLSSSYQILHQTSAGADGVAFAAVDTATDVQIELWKLAATTPSPERSTEITQRLKLVQLLEHPTSRRVHAVSQDGEQTVVAVDLAAKHDLRDWQLLGGPDFNPLSILQSVVDALAAAHQLGLTHEALCPQAVRLTKQLDLQLDFTRIAVGPRPEPPPRTSTR